MTNEEAIEILRIHKEFFGEEIEMALNIAIRSLERESCNGNISFAADVAIGVLGDEPCNFNDMDDCVDEWCAENCGKVSTKACWEHAIEERWYEVNG